MRRNGDDLRLLISLRHEVFIQRRLGPEPLSWNHTLLAVPRNGGDEVIVGELPANQGRFGPEIVPKRLNIATQRVTSLALGAPENAVSWLFDPAGEPRIVSSLREGRTTVHRRASGKTEWSQIAAFPMLAAAFTPAFLDTDGGLYVTVSTGREGSGELRRFDFAAGRVGAAPVVPAYVHLRN